MDYRNMTAPCGLDCFNCLIYKARDNEKLRSMISERRGIPLEEAFCNGCRNEGGTIGFLKMTEPCNVYRCISAKRLDFCCECDEFPCDHLHPYADRASEVPHNTKVFNLCLIRRMGLDEWARDKAKDVNQTYFKGTLKL